MNLRPDDVLAIFVGAVVVDVLFLLMNYASVIFVSSELTRWYTRLGPSAMAMDIIVIALATMLGLYVAESIFGPKPNALQIAGCVVGVQVAHDMLFATLFTSVPRGKVWIFDVFKDYAAEVGGHAIWADSLMMLGTLLIAEGVSHAKGATQNVLLLVAIYVGLYVLYAKKPLISVV